ncbi:hypothetical protein [Ammoniphilus sp. CFH 90114]|uniref:hypothetical protein n=1 Tax=Ammoniphilus sp. CFH 90114 TaxID=2493665 RepID=UPI00100E9414|nr:hypothetical protein [Ammoniphilus sp. CFH 90114]RXT08930.1 hypothetical protein EIZ39_09040 [Ammoniphilus sp. CFH 90114]
MKDLKVTSITYTNESPKESLIWFHQLLTKLIIDELKLDPFHAGSFIMSAHQFLKLIENMEDKGEVNND